jgi:hypothetical protein
MKMLAFKDISSIMQLSSAIMVNWFFKSSECPSQSPAGKVALKTLHLIFLIQIALDNDSEQTSHNLHQFKIALCVF